MSKPSTTPPGSARHSPGPPVRHGAALDARQRLLELRAVHRDPDSLALAIERRPRQGDPPPGRSFRARDRGTPVPRLADELSPTLVRLAAEGKSVSLEIRVVTSTVRFPDAIIVFIDRSGGDPPTDVLEFSGTGELETTSAGASGGG